MGTPSISTSARKTAFFIPFIISFSLIFLVLVGAVGWRLLHQIEDEGKKKSVDTLEAVLNTLQASTQLLISNNMQMARNWAKHPRLLESVQRQLQVPRNRASLNESPALEEIRDFFRDQIEGHGFRGLFVISPDKRSIASMGPLLGNENLISLQNPGLIDRVFNGQSLVTPPVYSRQPLVNSKGNKRQRAPTIFVVVPIQDDSGEAIAALAIRFVTTNAFRILSEGGRISETSQSYFFDDKGRLLSESRFRDQFVAAGLIDEEDSSVMNVELRTPGFDLSATDVSVLSQGEMPLTLMAASATSGSDGRNDVGYKDYRGRSVIGAWRWDNRLRIGMAAEMDLDEAIQSTQQTKETFLASMGALAFLFVGLVGVIAVIKQRSEGELRRLAEAVSNANEAIAITDAEGFVIYTNPEYEKLFEVSPQDLRNQKPPIFEIEDEQGVNRAGLRSCLNQGKAWAGCFRDKSPNGEDLFLDTIVSPIAKPNGSLLGYVLLQRDVTEQAKLEEMLRQSQKMEAIGRLAGGIAHDFNNLLAGIQGHAELALQTVPPKAPLHADLKEILNASLRGADLVTQILSFSRKSSHKREPVNVAWVIESSLSLLKHSLPRSITLSKTIFSDSSIVIADETQLQQIILNLCSNAAGAIGENPGVIAVSLSDQQIDEDMARTLGLKEAGEYLRLAVSDNGDGIAPEDLNKVFDPFFTTKEIGQGTGLGLAQAHSIVESHQGIIDVESSLGKGTTFIIYLPKAKDQTLPERESTDHKPVPRSEGMERVLIVDDDIVISNVYSRILENHGYATLALNDSSEALELYRTDTKGFDLVITDQSMPGLKGEELIAEIRKIKETQPIILCSGNLDKATEERIKALNPNYCLFKPVSKDALMTASREAIDHGKPKIVD